MRSFFKTLSGFALFSSSAFLANGQTLLAQGKAETISICLQPEMKTDAKGKAVLQDLNQGDKVKGFLFQNTGSPVSCADALQSSQFTRRNIVLKLHGQSSQTYNQKSYGIEFVGTDFKSLPNDQQIRFGGLPRGEKFVLTSNYVDRSNMRNPLAYSLAKEMGNGSHGTEGAPDYFGTHYTFAEVNVQDDYKGLYTLSARVERGPERLAIAKVTEDNFENFDWIGEICTGVKTADYHSKRKTYLAFHEPELSDLAKFKDQNKAAIAKNQMVTQIEQFEDMMSSTRFADPKTGYPAFIDVPNFIEFIILEEVAKNVDGFRRSVWFRHVDGKFKMGPVWDFDAAFGNLVTYNMALPSGWLLDFGQGTFFSPGGLEQFPAAFWFRRLMEDPAFANQVKARYRGMRMPGGILHDDQITALIKRLRQDIGDAGLRSEKRWKNTRVNPLHSIIFHAPPFDRGYEKGVDNLSSWIGKRLDWMDKNIGQIERRHL